MGVNVWSYNSLLKTDISCYGAKSVGLLAAEKKCRDFHRGIQQAIYQVCLGAESDAVATQEAFPVVRRKVAKAGVLEVVRSLRIVALATTLIT